MKTFFTNLAVIVFCLFAQLFASAQVSGTVFFDHNANGIRESGTITDHFVAGVTVKAYGSTGAQLGITKTTNASGSYNFTVAEIAAGTAVRIEFSGFGLGKSTGFNGTDNNSNIQFVNSPAVNVNFALSSPDEYSSTSNPYVAVPLQINGTYNNPVSGIQTSIFTFLYNATGNPTGGGYPSDNVPNTKSQISQTGALWGLAYQKKTKTLYASAVLRRFAGLGPLGTGGIYKTNMSAPAANTGAANFINVQSIGINTGADPRAATACDSISSDPDKPARDVTAANLVGKMGIGGIDFEEQTSTLWLANLYDGKLYGITNINPDVTPVAADVVGGYTIGLPAGYSVVDGILRLWAVKAYGGFIYIGAVADASNTNHISNLANLKGYVLKFNPNDAAAGFTVEFTFSFDYRHPDYGPNGGYSQWYNWQIAGFNTWDTWFKSPILSDIEFDVDGSLILGIADRAGLQTGGENYNDVICNNNLYVHGGAQGDILRACKQSGGGYVLSGQAGCTTAIPPAYLVDADGDPNAPNTYIQEYYWGDAAPLPSNIAFNEGALGALAFLPGSGQVMSTTMDAENWHSNGVKNFSNTTGGWDNLYNIYYSNPAVAPANAFHTFHKSSGLGDIELVTDYQPIQIGNRIWFDKNGNGIQDADEAGINGVMVQLVSPGPDGIFGNANDVVVANTTTATINGQDGSYFFSTLTTQDARKPASWLGVSNILPDYNYQIRIPNALGGSQQAPLVGYQVAQTDISTNLKDEIDNDAAPVGTSAIVEFNTNNINHSYDIGFVNNAILAAASLRLNATLNNEDVTLYWQTLNEINTTYFEVEISTNNQNFSKTGNNIPASVNSTTLKSYTFTENISNIQQNGVLYYRVKLYNANGTYQYSNTALVKFTASGINVWPNPFAEKINIQVTLQQSKKVAINILDSKGNIVKQEYRNMAKGTNQVPLSALQLLPKGIYLLQVVSVDGTVRFTQKITKE